MKRWIIAVALVLVLLVITAELVAYGMETKADWEELERVEHMYE